MARENFIRRGATSDLFPIGDVGVVNREKMKFIPQETDKRERKTFLQWLREHRKTVIPAGIAVGGGVVGGYLLLKGSDKTPHMNTMSTQKALNPTAVVETDPGYGKNKLAEIQRKYQSGAQSSGAGDLTEDEKMINAVKSDYRGSNKKLLLLPHKIVSREKVVKNDVELYKIRVKAGNSRFAMGYFLLPDKNEKNGYRIVGQIY